MSDVDWHYYITHKSWYARPEYGIEVMVVKGHPDGSCYWEFAIKWHSFDHSRKGYLTPQVRVFEDAWAAFTERPDLFSALGALHVEHGFTDQNSVEAITGLLGDLGFRDATERTR